MPILVDSNDDDDLSQGDILEGVKLFSTSSSLDEPEIIDAKYSIIVSRPCSIAHKKQLVVAPIKKGNPPGNVEDFDSIRKTLNAFRDGMTSPDRFYLGHLPDENGRFYALLDSLTTVSNESDSLKQKRIKTLSPEFRNDLSVRFFLAFSKQGFSDHSWQSTDDLTWLVAAGRSEIQIEESKLAGVTAAGTENSNAIQGREKKIEELKRSLLPYETELGSRNAKDK